MSVNIEKTTDYSQFDFLAEGRPVNDKHLERIKESIKRNNKLHCNPIIVNKKGFIIDGQHRYMAAMELNLPIYFIQDKESKIQDVIDLNCTRNNWSVEDYIRFHAVKGNEDYIKFMNLIKICREYNPNVTTCTSIVGFLTGGSGRTFLDSIKTGHWKIRNCEFMIRFIEKTFPKIKEINHRINSLGQKICRNQFFKKPFLNALCIFFKKMNDAQYKDLLECIFRDFDKVPDTNNLSPAIEFCIRSYNFKRLKKNILDKDDFIPKSISLACEY